MISPLVFFLLRIVLASHRILSIDLSGWFVLISPSKNNRMYIVEEALSEGCPE